MIPLASLKKPFTEHGLRNFLLMESPLLCGLQNSIYSPNKTLNYIAISEENAAEEGKPFLFCLTTITRRQQSEFL